MSQMIYNIFLLVTLLMVISTPVNASPLIQRLPTDCCPVSVCVFRQGQNPLKLLTSEFGLPAPKLAGYNANTFNGILSFTESPQNSLQISGFLDIDGVINGPSPFFLPGGPVEIAYDIHVAKCDANISSTPGDMVGIDLDNQSFDKPIITTSRNSINDIKDKCCFVVEEFAFNLGSKPIVQRIYGVAPVSPIVTREGNNCVPHSPPPNIPPPCSVTPTTSTYSSSSTYPTSTYIAGTPDSTPDDASSSTPDAPASTPDAPASTPDAPASD